MSQGKAVFRIALALLVLLTPGIARAEWREATSKHFIVYSEGGEETLRRAVSDLEKYDLVLRWASRITRPDAAVKLRIFLMANQNELSGTMPEGGADGILGYYTVARLRPVAFGLRRTPGYVEGMNAQEVLFHEYAHHIMYQYFPAAYPSWYTEGFAEFYGTTRIGENDVIEVGHAALARYRSFGEDWLPLKKMLTAKSYEDVGDDIGLLYAQGWLLVHYLANTPERKGQLEKYLAAINSGRSFEEARDTAFGPDGKKLDGELRAYSRQRAVKALRIPFRPIDVGPIQFRTLGPAEQALVDEEIKLSRGLLKMEAADFAQKVRRKAKQFPDDPYALSMLVEAERAAGNAAGAAAAVERWLAVKPGAARAMMHKAQLRIEALQKSASTDAEAWQSARAMLVGANKTDPKDPAILAAYYDSFAASGTLPPAGAQNALYRAFEMVPQDDELRYKLALDFEKRGMITDAIATIKPAAFSLSSEDESAREKRRREKLEDKYRAVGQQKRETAVEMLKRLEQKLAKAGPQPS